ncbi:malto-oligosyltrehalose synthase [Kosakonia cowanii]|nr:malto-oligosyltrehalose synthase [Kosakonia cowanii]MDP9770330.1 (1->4)-alpha-D-glucan 1-alpha-D-glucosylmutase [Atlantibacter hermannii]TPD68954.1 malto-oligosyltrehalose synthase [Kosakonia cowanii]TPD91990.1 malto-oligosyltrehalose synthase [Kosakonia cowanii]TPE09339.1 malto-oligosyltrehalose synthase [Kosakonia cowanii]
MSTPTATYRLQFRNGMTFERAVALVPYIKKLGISHLYASPIFTATSGSTHGYDVTDANEIDPTLGGREGFDKLAQALKAAGLGLIIDIVPNHMAASLENAWWRDVIAKGEKSQWARHFDIDWSRRLTLPFLGEDFDAVVEKGELKVEADPQTGKPAFVYYESVYPLVEASWQGREQEILGLTDAAKIAELHEQQPWRLMSWRDAASDLSYRRFFEITGLVGMRVEDDQVFDDTHKLILELVHSGAVDGLRVDHVDGLADPRGYLMRLRQKAGDDCHITVEKILGKGEHLPDDWPVSGTTGYEFIAALSDVLVDDENLDGLREAYDQVVGKPVDMKAELRSAKLLMVDRNFAGEFSVLLRLAGDIAGHKASAPAEEALRQALRELLIAFPVYRTYGTAQGLPPADLALLQKVVSKVKASSFAPQPTALDFITRILTGDLPDSARDEAARFRTRFQQLTGPLMAKSVEDTLFFRQNMDLALNEVGAEPLRRNFSLARFHQEMQTRLEKQPDALSGTSTHDTKRGEDARARLYTLTEAPARWAECVTRWREMNKDKVSMLEDGPAPRPAVAWMIYQALAGVWPVTLQPDDAEGLKALEGRFVEFVEKALREAKQRTDWVDSNDAYESAVLDYVRHLLSPDNQPFLQDFTTSLLPFIRAGLVNSLTQTLIKLAAPGVPDIYQGSEALNFSLVDPDNRLEPDYPELERLLDAQEHADPRLQEGWSSGQLKQSFIARLLHLRQEKPALFRHGDYLPLNADGEQADNVIAFARVDEDDALIVLAPRLLFGALDGSLNGAVIPLPERLAHRHYRDMLSGEDVLLNDRVNLRSIGGFTFAVLVSA